MASTESRVSAHPDFPQVYGEFHPRIQRYLTRLLGTNEADDATQEVFAKISQALPQFRGESSLSTWIYRIATNTAYDRLRSPSFQRAGEVQREFFGAAQRAPLLRRIAEETGGRYYSLETVAALPRDIVYTERGITTTEQLDLWDMPALFILMVLLMGAEWGYRRVRGLV